MSNFSLESGPEYRMTPIDLNNQGFLGTSQKKVLAALQQIWFNTNKIPTIAQLCLYTTVSAAEVEQCFTNNTFLLAASQAGIPVSDSENDNPHVALSLIQIQVANALLNHMDKRSVRQKLSEFGIKAATLKGWMAHTPFKNYINNRAGSDLLSLDWLSNTKLTELVEEGDLAAIKLAKELTGKLTQKVQVDVNLNLFLIRLVDIITARVEDPTLRELIAIDVESLALEFMPKGMG